MILNIRALAALVVLSSLNAAACAAPTEATAPEADETTQDLVSRSAYFETFEGEDGQFYFHLMAANGENVLRSEGYATLAAAENGAAAVLANGNDKRNFELRAAANGEVYFVLKAGNGEVVGTSELYASKSNAERGAVTVRRLVRVVLDGSLQNAPKRERFEIFAGEDGKTYFRVRAGNGEIVLGSQGYTSRKGAQKGIASVVTNGADKAAYDVFEAGDGQWGVRLVAKNGEVVARGELYASKSNATRAVTRLTQMLRGGLPVE